MTTSEYSQDLRAILDVMHLVLDTEIEAAKKELEEATKANKTLEEKLNELELIATGTESVEANAKNKTGAGASLVAPDEGTSTEFEDATQSPAREDANAKLYDPSDIKARIKAARASGVAEFEIESTNVLSGKLLEDLATEGDCDLIFATKDGVPLSEKENAAVRELIELGKENAKKIADL